VPAGYAGGHQRENAQWLVDSGAAEILDERDLGTLAERVKRLLDDGPRLAAMRTAAASLARPDAAAAIAQIIEEVAAR
jgi:UDP-N-acetylglucosamine--N-acetylmuramyl-(pentapeptide) pyrophosphoryl-undecaprenol N-acetylglucosamine transferase